MGKGRHVVIHDVIHDDNQMGNRPISYQDVALCLCSMFISLNKIKIKYSLHQYSILMHILGNWLIL